ncbi:MAG: DUF3106 domain-containing protein [Pedosphaera sp.]|nr:DUF3106 domain-containing protein [Pedosphaera sp.]
MNEGRKFFLLLAMLAVGVSAFAQTNAVLPPLPPLKSPVDTFRELLNMTSAERQKALATGSAEWQRRVLEKLRGYQSLGADERELILRATELRWWLLQLMRQPATNRAAGLVQIPAHLRKLVDDRLSVWDLLPPPLQKDLLDNEELAQKFTQIQGSTPDQRERMLKSLSPDRRQWLEAGLERWAAMNADERRKTCERFDQYFELTPREKKKVLATLSDTERQQMEQALRSFEKLPREKRILCVRSFEKFAGMDVAERQQFLKNAERWEKMSPTERKAWRDLVKTVPEFPPLPSGFGELSPPLPPSLPRAPQPPVTNGGG